MKNAIWDSHHILRLFVIAAMSVTVSAPATTNAQMSSVAVQVNAEPDHHIVFENVKVRMYEVVLPRGKSTLRHEHRADNFQVFFNDSNFINDPGGGAAMLYPSSAGYVGFTSTANGPYTHRIEGAGDTPFRVIAIELLASSSQAVGAGSARRPSPPFRAALETERGRAYRVSLNAGESTGTFTRPANTAIFAISSGRISEQTEGKTPTQWDFNSGNFRWSETSEKLSMKNEGASRVELVEIEIY